MMLRILVVAALLATALSAQARPLADADEGAVAASLPDLAAGPRMGNPLLDVDPAYWLPILREQGHADAARATDHRQAQQSQAEPMEVEEDQVTVEHWFMPLGDANGNGRDDLVLGILDMEEESVSYQALDGGRLDEVLWTLDLPEDEYAYITGDVDEDGVYDLEHIIEQDGSYDEGDEGSSEWEHRANINILSGRDLATMTSLQVVSRSSYEETRPEPVPLVGTSTSRETYSYEYVMDIDGIPGLVRMAYGFEFYQSEDRVVITTDSRSSFNTSTSFALLDVAGALVWSFDEEGFDVSYAHRDVTGDDVPDVIVRSNDEWDFGEDGGLVDPPVEPPIPVPILTQDEAERPPYQVKLLDGADGAVLWEREFGNATFGYVGWLGDLYGEGDVLEMYTVDFDPESYEISETYAFLDADTGETVRELAAIRSFAPLGDANGDGRDDLLELDFDDSTLGFTAYDGELNELWDTSVPDDDLAGIIDMTSDGVVDLVTLKDDVLTVLSGTDGDALWSRAESRLHDFDITPGIVDEEDRELALLLSDAKEHEDVADHKADLLILRGADGAPLWRKPLYDPADYVDVAGDDAFVWVSHAGDLNADGANDFIVDFEQGYTITISTTCVNGECETEMEDSRDDDEGQPMNIVAVVDGATGATLLRYDDMELSGRAKVAERVVEEAPTVSPAAEELVPEDAPALAPFAALAAIGLAFIARRRKA